MARVSILGLGRVGLATGVGFAIHGHHVTCYDIDPVKVRTIGAGKQPYREKGLSEALRRVVRSGAFKVAESPHDCLHDAQYYFICVGTPPARDGSMDSSYIREAAGSVGYEVRGRRDYPIVVVKSTVVPGTTENVVLPLVKKASRLSRGSFGLCMNPEFLREGTALEDTMRPDRIVIGSDGPRAGDALERLYAGFKGVVWRCDVPTAEMVKYASNAFLATKVTFANEMANLCGRLGLDSDKVLEGMALDSRIGPKFLVPGAGFGGPCLPKDLKAIVSVSEKLGYSPRLLRAVLETNHAQAVRMVDMLQKEIGTLKGKRVAVLGLAFKPETDDARDSQVIPIITTLLKRRATVAVHDPAATLSSLGVNLPVRETQTAGEALRDSDGCIIQTAWAEYKRLGHADFALMRRSVVIDGRRTLDLKKIPPGLIYRRVG